MDALRRGHAFDGFSRARLAPAKVNLFLHVGAPGDDGYHPLCSLMAFADFGDVVAINRADVTTLALAGPFAKELDNGPGNLVLRAVRALIMEARRPVAPVALGLDKQLPVASGLGGGSSDAGAALRLIRDELGLAVDDARLEAVAAGLGADGAACLWGRPVLAQGRGERLSPAPSMPVLDAVLAQPRVPVSTPEVYRRFDVEGRFGDVRPPPMPEAFEGLAEVAAWLSIQRNDLQDAALKVAPEVGAVLSTLAGEPETLLARVSGSGGACFALCADEIAAETLAERVRAMAPEWWVRRCRLGGPWD